MHLRAKIEALKDHVYRKYFGQISLRTNNRYNMAFKNIKRWHVIKMFNDYIPRSNCIREETIHVSH